MADEGTARIEEIRSGFDERGFDLVLHEHDDGWRAPYMRKGSRIGSADYGFGTTALAAAENAWARFSAVHEAGTNTSRHTHSSSEAIEESSKVIVGAATEASASFEVRVEGGLPAIEETLTGYGWRIWFEDEPDGSVTAVLQNYRSGEFIKQAQGDDHTDAWLELGVDTLPPSQEVRRAQSE